MSAWLKLAGCRIHHFIMTLQMDLRYSLGRHSDLVCQTKNNSDHCSCFLLRVCSLLILDRTTNIFDTRTEELIQKAMDRLMEESFAVIAHRLSTIRNADTILVMKDGNIIEQGNHDELMAQAECFTWPPQQSVYRGWSGKNRSQETDDYTILEDKWPISKIWVSDEGNIWKIIKNNLWPTLLVD